MAPGENTALNNIQYRRGQLKQRIQDVLQEFRQTRPNKSPLESQYEAAQKRIEEHRARIRDLDTEKAISQQAIDNEMNSMKSLSSRIEEEKKEERQRLVEEEKEISKILVEIGSLL